MLRDRGFSFGRLGSVVFVRGIIILNDTKPNLGDKMTERKLTKMEKKLIASIEEKMDPYPDQSLDFFIGAYFEKIDSSKLSEVQANLAKIISVKLVTEIWKKRNQG